MADSHLETKRLENALTKEKNTLLNYDEYNTHLAVCQRLSLDNTYKCSNSKNQISKQDEQTLVTLPVPTIHGNIQNDVEKGISSVPKLPYLTTKTTQKDQTPYNQTVTDITEINTASTFHSQHKKKKKRKHKRKIENEDFSINESYTQTHEAGTEIEGQSNGRRKKKGRKEPSDENYTNNIHCQNTDDFNEVKKTVNSVVLNENVENDMAYGGNMNKLYDAGQDESSPQKTTDTVMMTENDLADGNDMYKLHGDDTTNKDGNIQQETTNTIIMMQRHSLCNKVSDVQDGYSLYRRKHKKKKRRKAEKDQDGNIPQETTDTIMTIENDLAYDNDINKLNFRNTTNRDGNISQETTNTIMMKQRHSFNNKVLPDVQDGDSLHRRKHKKKKRSKTEQDQDGNIPQKATDTMMMIEDDLAYGNDANKQKFRRTTNRDGNIPQVTTNTIMMKQSHFFRSKVSPDLQDGDLLHQQKHKKKKKKRRKTEQDQDGHIPQETTDTILMIENDLADCNDMNKLHYRNTTNQDGSITQVTMI